MREYVWLECTRAGTATTASRRKRGAPNRLELKKYCRRERKQRRTRSRARSKSTCTRAGLIRVPGECDVAAGAASSDRLGRPVADEAGATDRAECDASADYERSSIGRAPVSKTGGWGFDSLRSCCREAACRGASRRA